ncbi:hypothetical protein BKA61DRAFT_481846, partial [Leptodontidium sp. MPI-SDFR-AT-0119]
LNIFFYIDSLNKFNSNTKQLYLFFKYLSTKSNSAKFCLSSRPWVLFKENFKGYSSLRLHDLIANNINTYVIDKFRESTTLRKLKARYTRLTLSLALEITERA